MSRREFAIFEIELVSGPAFPNGLIARRPCVNVQLKKGNQTSQSVIGVVDTGADYCMFPSELLSEIGGDPNSALPYDVFGVGGKKSLKFATVTLVAEEIWEWDAYLGFDDSLNGQHFALLGYVGFLERFRFELDGKRRTFVLEEL